MQLHIRHETTYRYAAPIRHSTQSLRLTPRLDAGQRLLQWTITAPGRRAEQRDAHDNVFHLLTNTDSLTTLTVTAQGIVETDGRLAACVPSRGCLAPMVYRTPTELTLANESIIQIAQQTLNQPGRLQDRLERLSAEIFARIRYKQGVTEVHEDAATVLARGEGVCQDQTHAFLACCRAGGVPARYVSGYFYAGKAYDVASHAWAEAWLGEEIGWMSFDLTHQSQADERHCRLAVGRDYKDAAPLRGIRQGGGDESLSVIVVVADSAAAAQQQYDEQRTRVLQNQKQPEAADIKRVESLAAARRQALQAQQ